MQMGGKKLPDSGPAVTAPLPRRWKCHRQGFLLLWSTRFEILLCFFMPAKLRHIFLFLVPRLGMQSASWHLDRSRSVF